MDPYRLAAGRGSGLADGTLDAVGHEVDRGAGSRPSGRNVVRENEGRPPCVIPAPAIGDVERTPPGERGAELGPERAKMLGAGRRHLERHGISPARVELDVTRVDVPVEHF